MRRSPLERLAAVVDFEIFRPVLDAALARSDRSRGGRPPYDAVLMFRILMLQALYSLSDQQAELQLAEMLADKGYLAIGGQIIDATLIAAPRQKLDTSRNPLVMMTAG